MLKGFAAWGGCKAMLRAKHWLKQPARLCI